MNDSESKPTPLLRRVIYLLVSFVALILSLIGIALFNTRGFFAAEILDNFRLQVAVAILFSAFGLYYINSKIWAVAQLTLALAAAYPIALAMIPQSQPSEPGPRRITLMSYNLLGDNEDVEPVIKKIKDVMPDILVVLEYENQWIDALREMPRYYYYFLRQPRWHGFGIAIYSKFQIPLYSTLLITRDYTDNPLLLTEIDIEDQKVIIVAGHFLAPLTIEKMKIRNQQFAETSAAIKEFRKDSDSPVIFVGDLNCVPWSPHAIDLMEANELRDSRQGYLYHGSWPTDNLAMCIPIDNAFVSDRIHIHNREIMSADSSDHYPLFLEFSIAEDE